MQAKPPEILVLQETDTPQPTLRGYKTYSSDLIHRTAVLVNKDLTAQEHLIALSIAHTFIEIIPVKPGQRSLFMLNVHSPPNQLLTEINPLLAVAIKKAGPNPLVFLGDFNAPHHSWGYPQVPKMGTALLQATQHFQLVLWNDLTYPTRLGTSVSRDTIPDLTFVRHVN
ncbi:hypothetical protein HPB48_003296 [Haemaphysalis longicornis]|uniref:Endonuclease/exonuclease/phosphatase domain-containing protein n=1 Tax=Haemaphysalis longicornis TaxID=44386 RepID=A0A9J6GM64_HAELO|nr:hypothetical protein HPB48_003296 [Haemaphysalis longicornis]